MADLLRLSVRGLVGFTVFPPDIQPLPASLMEEGRAAHLARQKISGAQREAALTWRGKVEGLEVLVTGRMDLFDEGAEPPLIEEIKLCGEEAPTEPRREHLYQALCYGFMQGTAAPRPAFQIRVSYVDRAGTLRAAFEETWRFEALQAVFMELLLPCVSWHKRLMAARARRDKSLESLPFPYPDYRAGQREMAAQVYTAISRRRRLFAVMPTGTGKSAAVLYPAFKALGLHLTGQIFCLTARTTAREAMEKEAQRMRGLGLKARVLTLNAKEKLCPQREMRCDPVHCPRAKGHYERQPAGLLGALRRPLWDTAGVLCLAERFQLCPFEFSLALCEVADAVICDYNYFLDPRLRIKRIFEQPGEVTVLIDEAHNLPGRVGDMLSGDLDSAAIALMRREAGAALGRKGKLYRQATRLLACLRGLAPDALAPPDVLLPALEELMAALSAQPQFPIDPALIRDILGFMDALKRRAAAPVDYLLLCQEKGKERSLRLLCLNITPHLHKATARLAGLVCYSATLAPLQQMRALLGGAEEDACFELPSPFPGEHMLTLQLPLDTRYQQRERSLLPIADALRALCLAKPGKYIAFFPSYQYMQDVALLLQDLPLHVQQGGMDDKARAEYLARFSLDGQPLLALAVLGGVFAEGIDLPGLKLIGVCVVGVGLPQVNRQREAIRERAEGQGMDGFDVAYRYPGMHKVLQAAGRLIRSQDDRGVLLLLDERFQQPACRRLLPGHWQVRALKNVAQMTDALQEFWSR